jgi:hypothetical protein
MVEAALATATALLAAGLQRALKRRTEPTA